MKVLAHEPRGNDRIEHYATEDQGYWFALCRPTLREGKETTHGVWELRDKQPGDEICETCKAKKERLDNPPPPKPKLPCTEPDKLVALWIRKDGKHLLTHAYNTKKGMKAHCGVGNKIYAPNRWIEQPNQPAHKITCELCMKAVRLWPNWPPHKYRKSDRQQGNSERRMESKREIEAKKLKAWGNTGIEK